MPGRDASQPPQRGPASPPPPPPGIRRRDQRWALHAYNAIATVSEAEQASYEIAVNSLGADLLRNGLSAALATLERQKDSRGRALLQHLASAGVAGLANATAQDLARRVRELEVDGYTIATREILQLATWLKRAAQATFGGR